MTSSVASEYLARTLYLRSEDDLKFMFDAVERIERILDDGVLAIVPSHARDLEAAARTCKLIREQGARVCVFLNCLEQELSDEQFAEALKDFAALLEKSGCRVGSDTALVGRRHGSEIKMGKVRGSIADACLIASMNVVKRGPFAFFDADMLAISETFVSAVQKAFDSHRPMMSVGAVHYGCRPNGESCLPGEIRIPELLLADRVNQAILRCARNGQINFERRVWAEGASLVFDPIAYCKVGGFNWALPSGEDDAFGRAVHRYNPRALSFPLSDLESVFEKRAQNVLFVDAAWVVTDPRRHLKAIAEGGGGTEAWDYAPFHEQPGHEIATQSLIDEYKSSSKRITDRMLLEWDEQHISLAPWAGARVVRLIGRMLQADRRIRNDAQAHSVWVELGFEDGVPAIEPMGKGLEVCGKLLRPC